MLHETLDALINALNDTKTDADRIATRRHAGRGYDAAVQARRAYRDGRVDAALDAIHAARDAAYHARGDERTNKQETAFLQAMTDEADAARDALEWINAERRNAAAMRSRYHAARSDASFALVERDDAAALHSAADAAALLAAVGRAEASIARDDTHPGIVAERALNAVDVPLNANPGTPARTREAIAHAVHDALNTMTRAGA